MLTAYVAVVIRQVCATADRIVPFPINGISYRIDVVCILARRADGVVVVKPFHRLTSYCGMVVHTSYNVCTTQLLAILPLRQYQ